MTSTKPIVEDTPWRPVAIRAESYRLLSKIKKHQYALATLRDEVCKHPSVSKVARSNTGNYDPHADSYWYACSCPDCGKKWDEDQ